MTIPTTRRRAGAGIAVLAAAALVLTGCSPDDGLDAAGDGSSTLTEEPPAGVPSSYKGTLPAPEIGAAYSNPQERDALKQGGTFTLETAEIGPNWNSMSVDGNTVDMGTMWSYYMPTNLWDYDVAGNPTPNPDYLTNVEVTSEDPLVVTYDINPDAVFNDGTPLDWTAFEATWKTQSGKDPAFNPASTTGYDQVASVEKGDDDKQAVVTFDEPFFPYQYLFGGVEHPDLADAKTYTKGFVNEPHNEYGAGPYVVESSDETQAVMVPNDKWWGEKPLLDKVTFKAMEPTASINAFQNGELDVTSVSTADRLKVARAMDDVDIRINYATSVRVFVLNAKADSLKDDQVRKSIIQSVDAAQLNDIRNQGLDWEEGPAGSTIMYPFQEGYQDNMPEDLKFSTENAKATLEAAGYEQGEDGYYAKDGETAHVTYTLFGDDPVQSAIAKAVQKMTKDAGIELEIVNVASEEFSTTVTSGEYEMLSMGWSAGDPYGPQTSGCQLFCSDSESNFSYIGTDEIDDAMKAPGKTEDLAESVAQFNEAESEGFELYGQWATGYGPVMTAAKHGLANFGPDGFQSFHAEDVGWEK